MKDRERRCQPRGGVSHSHRRILRSGEARPRGRQREKTPAQGRSQPQPQMHPQIWRSMAEREMGRRRLLVQTMTAADTQRDEASSQEGQDTPSKNLKVIWTQPQPNSN